MLGDVDVRRKGERWEDGLDKKAAAGGARAQEARARGKGKGLRYRKKAGAGAKQEVGERRQVQQALRELQMARIRMERRGRWKEESSASTRDCKKNIKR